MAISRKCGGKVQIQPNASDSKRDFNRFVINGTPPRAITSHYGSKMELGSIERITLGVNRPAGNIEPSMNLLPMAEVVVMKVVNEQPSFDVHIWHTKEEGGMLKWFKAGEHSDVILEWEIPGPKQVAVA